MTAVLAMSFDQWRSPRAGDESVLARCAGPTLDVGCGPGRMAGALAAAGIPALGIDISGYAVAEARARGATVLHRDVFGDVPAVGRWHHVLLLDGNIGIAANPLRLLRRCRSSVRTAGSLLVEAEPPGFGVEELVLQLDHDGVPTPPIPWARVGVDVVVELAREALLRAVDLWSVNGRWFVELAAPRPSEVAAARGARTCGNSWSG